MARFQFAAALLLLLAGCTSDSPLAPGDDAAYPTTIPALSAEAQAALEAEFAGENPDLCSSLNAYGFTDGICSGGLATGEDPDAERLVPLARDLVARNARFTGVTNPAGLIVSRTVSGPNFLRVDFEPQVRAGMPVDRTTIRVYLNHEGPYAVTGNHYPDVHMPRAWYPAGKAQASLLGFKIHYSDWTGGKDYVVDQDSFQGDPVRLIYPLETESGIELHVAWRVVVGFFAVYVDTATLERIAIRQLVSF